MVASLLSKQEATAKAWVNAGKVASVEEYYEKTGVVVASTEHTHEDGVSHSHEGGDVEHTHEEAPKPKRRRRKSK